jgi:hypothetical protein
LRMIVCGTDCGLSLADVERGGELCNQLAMWCQTG